MSQIDIARGALVITLFEEYGFEAHLAAKAALAAHPLDDNPVPSRAFEKQVRKVSRQYGKVLRNLRGKPQEAEVLTLKTLKTLQSYKNLAIQHGESHYINRYDKALNNEPPTIPPQLEADVKMGPDENDLAEARREVARLESKAESIRSELAVLKRDNHDDPRIQERTDALEEMERTAEDLARLVSDADAGLIQIQPVEKEVSEEEHLRNFAEALGLTVNDVQTHYRSIAAFRVELDDIGWNTIQVTFSIPSIPGNVIYYMEEAREVRQLTPQKAMRMMRKAAKRV